MHDVSDRFNDALLASHEITTSLTVTPIGGVTTSLRPARGTVTLAAGTGPRASANITVGAIDKSAAGAVEGTASTALGEGLLGSGALGGAGVPASSGTVVDATPVYPLISAEGAEFELSHGFKYGTYSELIPMGVFGATTVPGPMFASTYEVRLIDRWAALEEAEFPEPFQPPAGTRASIITARILAVFPDATIIDQTTAGGGVNPGTAVWPRSRTQLIRDMARDGAIECFFDALGRWVMRDEPALSSMPAPGVPLFTLTTGEVGSILEAERERPVERRVNVVVVEPSGEQEWPRQHVAISDVNHPRHSSKIGTRPYFMTAPTAASQGDAWNAGNAQLQRLLKAATLRRVRAISNPSIEPGDIGVMFHLPTPVDPGVNENVIVREVTHDLTSGLMDISLSSSELVEVG